MTDASQSSGGLTPEVIEVFARGLYHIANVDGIDDRESKLISEFLEESGSGLSLEDLAGPFSFMEAALALETSHIRRVFIRAAVAMVRADGVYSDPERKALGEMADAFGISNAEFGALEQEASRMSLDE